MSLTRKHYVAIAGIISEQMKASSDSVAGTEAARNIAIELAATFKADNPRFNADTFFRAASVN